MNPIIKTANQPIHFKQERTKMLINCNLSDNKRQQTTTVDYKRLINGLFLTNDISLRHKSRNILETTQKQAKNKRNKPKTWTKELKNEKRWLH